MLMNDFLQVNMALTGIQMLLNFDVIPPADVKNILRVLTIQLAAKTEFQLKLLQILLQLANSLSQNATTSQYMTEATVSSLLTLSLQLCDGRSNVSVSSTALATARQIVALVMDAANAVYADNYPAETETSSGSAVAAASASAASADIRNEQISASSSLSAQLLVKDLVLFATCRAGEWIKGTWQQLHLITSALLTQPAIYISARSCRCPAAAGLRSGSSSRRLHHMEEAVPVYPALQYHAQVAAVSRAQVPTEESTGRLSAQ
jgi:hypothetical protein